MMASGIPVYFLFIGWKTKPACIQKALGIRALHDSFDYQFFFPSFCRLHERLMLICARLKWCMLILVT